MSRIVFSAQEVTIVRLNGIFRPVEGVAGRFFCASADDAPPNPSRSNANKVRKDLDNIITIYSQICIPRRAVGLDSPRQEDAQQLAEGGQEGITEDYGPVILAGR